MRRLALLTGLASSTLLVSAAVRAAPTLRLQVDQHGDMLLIGNTLAHDCAGGTVAPLVGAVGACGNNTGDSAPDIFWRADDTAASASNAVTVAEARSTAILTLPAGATVTHAWLYWAAESPGNAADTQVTLERPGGFSQSVTAIDSYTATYSNLTYYQSVADVTFLIAANGSGAYRISGVDSVNLVNRLDHGSFAAWTLVVFYERAADPPRNLALFDGLDVVDQGAPANATLAGFLVPNAGFDAKLGVIAYEGDGQINGDRLLFGVSPLTNANVLSDALNPADNFFNSTRSRLGAAVSTAGDLPQLAGTPRSMDSFDLDVVDITNRVTAGQTSAAIRASSSGDVYFLGAFITSISTFKPDFTSSTKTVTDVNGGALLPGDLLEYTINVVNTGNDDAVNVVMIDPLPVGVTYEPGTIQVVSGPNAGAKTDDLNDDQGEYEAGARRVTVRLGTGANATQGGTLAIGESTTVRFRVRVDSNASGTISNQAEISSEGAKGAPQENTPTDGNGGEPGAPPTDVIIDHCAGDADCSPPTPYCLTTASPKICVECLTKTNCSGTTPVCNASHVCVGCTSNADCGGTTPACQPSGACGQCNATNKTQCKGTTPACDIATGTCVGCTSDANCSGATPACQPSGACGQCSATNTALCTGTKPVCETTSGTCVQCLSSNECSGATPACDLNTHTCVACQSDSDCGGSTPACQPSGACGQCSASNTSLCTGTTPLCNVATGTCVVCVANTDCTPLLPTCDPGTNTCVCVATGPEVCGNVIDDDCNGQAEEGCADSDDDGLNDALEINIGTDPNDADSEDDGVPDGAEPDYAKDTDGDGLINALDPDSDDDGLFDGTELGLDCGTPATDLNAHHCRPDADPSTTTDPLLKDSDGGGRSDGSEDANLNGALDPGETDPTAGHAADDSTMADTDGDGLSDALEAFLHSNPNDADTDDDGLLDGAEHNPSDDTDRDGAGNVLDTDSDNDGLYDGTEDGKGCDDDATDTSKHHCIADGDHGATTTSPLLWDTDKGGASDGSEDANLNGVVDAGETDPTVGHGADDGQAIDDDGDGLSNALEAYLGSNPDDADTDDDGVLDGSEANPADDTDGDGNKNVSDEDSDGDGLFDGTEWGLGCANAATDDAAGHCIADADGGATVTSPVLPDTDFGGAKDGDEDTNKDGKVDAGERDPNNPADDKLGLPCTTDAECGGATSGIVCDNSTCVAGCRGTGGNGCPDGLECTSTDNSVGQCVTPSDSGTGGSAGSGGSAGTGGSAGSGGSAGTGGSGGGYDGGLGGMGATGGFGGTGGSAAGGAAGSSPAASDENILEGGGCSCSTAGDSSKGLAVGALMLGAGLWVASRRRRGR